MEKIIEKYKNMNSIRKICLKNKIDYSNFMKGKVNNQQKQKVIKGIKKEIVKLLEGVFDE